MIPSGTSPDTEALRQRLAFLEEARRHTLEALSQAMTLGDPGEAAPPTTAKGVLRQTGRLMERLAPFKVWAFFLVSQPGGVFELGLCHPQGKSASVFKEFCSLADSGTAAWALHHPHPVTTTSASGEQTLFVHAMATQARIQGLFLGLFGKGVQSIPDVSLHLITLVLRNAASLLESQELRALLRANQTDLRARDREVSSLARKVAKLEAKLAKAQRD